MSLQTSYRDRTHEAFDVITPEDYIKWVKRSLNRRFALDLAMDGAKTSRYRAGVRRFQVLVGRPATGEIDARLQNLLIRRNERSRAYMNWVHRALGLLENGIFTDPPRNRPSSSGSLKSNGMRLGIHQFQRREGLEVDGWVGPRTELFLFRRSGLAPPGHRVKRPPPDPPPPPPRVSVDTIRRAPVDRHGASRAERDELRCLRAFLIDAFSGDRLDDRYWRFRRVQNFGVMRIPTPRRAIREFERRCSTTATPDEVARCIANVHADIEKHLSRLANSLASQSGDGPVWETPECRQAKFFLSLARTRSPRSVYRCFLPMLINPLDVLCKLPGDP